MKRNREMVSMILIEDDDKKVRKFGEVLTNLELWHSVKVFNGFNTCIKHLESIRYQMPHVLFFDLSNKDNNCIDGIKTIRDDKRYKNVSIVVYDANAALTDEESFVAGANIYIQKTPNPFELKKVLKKVVNINWQYSAGKFNRETYFLSV